MQATFRNEEGFDQAQETVAKIEDSFSPDAFTAMGEGFDGLPEDAQDVVRSLLSHDWSDRGGDVLVEAYDELSAWLPLSSSAKLREFLELHNFIEPG